MQAAIGCAQLEKMDKVISDKRRVYKGYCKYLGQIQGLRMQEFQKEVDTVVWAVAVKIDPRAFPVRDRLMAGMLKAGIETRPGFYPFATMPLYRPYLDKKLPVAMETGACVSAYLLSIS